LPDSLWTYAGVAVISVLLSVFITLGVLAGINRTLDFGQHRALLSLESEFDAVRVEIETLSSSLDAVGRRLEAVEGLNGRVAAVELELEGVRTSINAVVEEMEATRTSLTALSEHVDELTRSVLRFDTFLEGLREVLDEIDLTGVPATSEGS
jgi:chromosome segregation ATPase